jgi:hypothetical protein
VRIAHPSQISYGLATSWSAAILAASARSPLKGSRFALKRAEMPALRLVSYNVAER